MDYKNVFDEYIKKYYDMSDPNIKEAYSHSINIMEISKLISNDIGLNLNETKLAEFIGLIHDLGRFEQIKSYNIFEDIVEHSAYTLDMLFNQNEISKYNIDSSKYTMIYNIIMNYKKDKNSNLKDDELLFSMILNDATSLDILNNIKIGSIEKKQMISKEVEKDFFNRKQIDDIKVTNQKEEIIEKLSLMFGLNFEYSFKYIDKNNIIDKIRETLKCDSEFNDYVGLMDLCVNERVKKYVR